MVKAKERAKEAWEPEKKALLAEFDKREQKIRWEAKHPEVLEPQNLEKWNEVNSKAEFVSLDLDQRYKLSGIEPERKEVSTSVPPFSRGFTPPASGEAPKEIRDWYLKRGITDEQWKKLGDK